jgi:hypothetical protein
MNMREYVVTIGNEEFHVLAPDLSFNRARYLGYKAYLRKHPTAGKISSLMNSGKARVHVAKDQRVKY